MPSSILPLLLLPLLIPPSLSLPPSPPIHCTNSTTPITCTISNAYGAWNDRRPCPIPSAIYPSTEPQLLAAVASARRLNLKIKVLSGFSHTITKLACPPPANSLLISTANYSSTATIDLAKRTMTVDAGMGLREVVDAAEEAGLSLPAATYWEGVSIGGLISTGCHGSSWRGKGGAVYEYVVGMRLVVPAEEDEGFAKVVEIDGNESELFDAARVSIGLLGVISKVDPNFSCISYSLLTNEI